MADRIIIQQAVADVLVGLDHAEDFILGNGAGIDELDPFGQAAAMDAADALIDAMLPDCDEETDEGADHSLMLRLGTAEGALDRIRSSHADDGFGHCILCWDVSGPMSKASPAPMPCAVLRSIAGADVRPE